MGGLVGGSWWGGSRHSPLVHVGHERQLQLMQLLASHLAFHGGFLPAPLSHPTACTTDCLADAIMASGDLRPPRGGPSNSAANSAAVPNQALPALLPQHGEWHPAGPLTALAPPAFSGQTVMPVAPPPPSLQQLVAADLRVPPAQLAMPLAQAQPGLLSSMFGSLPPEAFGLSAADAVAAETMLGDLPPGEAADLETLLLGLTPQSEEVRISLKVGCLQQEADRLGGGASLPLTTETRCIYWQLGFCHPVSPVPCLACSCMACTPTSCHHSFAPTFSPHWLCPTRQCR